MHAAAWLLAAVVALALFVRWLEPRMAFYPFPGETETPRDSGIPYEAITIDTADGEHVRAWIMHAPSPRARIVYFHGNGGNLSNWLPILATIVRHGYSVLAIDYRGYGLSTGRPTERGLYRDADATVARAWKDAVPDVPLIYWGRSLGGSVAAHAATVRRPDGLILESTFPEGKAAVRDSPVLTFLALFASYRFPTATFVNQTTMPVLQLHGDRDSIIPIAIGRDLFAHIREPKTFVVITGGDHNDAVAPDAAAYWSTIDAFVRGLRG
jgi:alpha-beta hydrolase superfamily lysophospholipase